MDVRPSRFAPEVVTLKLTFSKDGAARWLAHLDVMRLFERAFRRCDFPVALSQGYNPRPRLRFVLPSSVGVAARADVLFVDLVGEVGADLPRVAERLNAVLPDGVRVLAVEAVPEHARKSALHAYGFARYRIVFDCPLETDTDLVHALAEDFAQQETATVPDAEGRTRTVHPRLFVVDTAVERKQPDVLEVRVTTRFGQEGTIRASDLAAHLLSRVPGLELRSIERLGLGEVPHAARGVLAEGESER